MSRKLFLCKNKLFQDMVSDFQEINETPLETLVRWAGLAPKKFLRQDNPLIDEIKGFTQNQPFLSRHLIIAGIDALSSFNGKPGSIGILNMGAEGFGHAISAIKMHRRHDWGNIDIHYLYLPRIIIGDASYYGALHLDVLEKYGRSGNNSPRQVYDYLCQSGIFESDQILLADTGFFGSIPNLIYQIAQKYEPRHLGSLKGFLIKTSFMMHGGIEIPIIESTSGKSDRSDRFDDYIKYFDRHWQRSRDQPTELINRDGLLVPNTPIYEGKKLEMYLVARYLIEKSVKDFFK